MSGGRTASSNSQLTPQPSYKVLLCNVLSNLKAVQLRRGLCDRMAVVNASPI